jgi:hypothetical protein
MCESRQLARKPPADSSRDRLQAWDGPAPTGRATKALNRGDACYARRKRIYVRRHRSRPRGRTPGILGYSRRCYDGLVKIGVSLPEDVVAFADEAARLHLVGLPGNVRLSRGDTRLPKASIANVYDVQKVLRPDLMERLGTLPSERVAAIGSGLRLVLDL